MEVWGQEQPGVAEDGKGGEGEYVVYTMPQKLRGVRYASDRIG